MDVGHGGDGCGRGGDGYGRGGDGLGHGGDGLGHGGFFAGGTYKEGSDGNSIWLVAGVEIWLNILFKGSCFHS